MSRVKIKPLHQTLPDKADIKNAVVSQESQRVIPSFQLHNNKAYIIVNG